MRVLFISQLFDPEYSIKGLEFLRDLSAEGIDVDVITTFPNYPTGKLFPGYKLRLYSLEKKEGIRIFRIWSFISHSKSRIVRALTYLSFMLGALFVSLFIKRPDIVYAYHPQITTGIVGIILKKIRKIRFITDIQDLWPDALIATSGQKRNLIYEFIHLFCNFIYHQADHVVVLSKGYKQELINRGIDASKISIVYNWHADEQRDSSKNKHDIFTETSLQSSFRYKFIYAGNLGAAQALKPVIQAFSRCTKLSVCLMIIGSGVEEQDLKNYAISIGAENIYFLGYIQPKNIKSYLAQTDVFVVHLKDEPLFKITIPSKVQACLSAGKPILMAVGGEANQIIEEAQAGISAEPENVGSIAKGIETLISKSDEWAIMGSNGRRYYYAHMARSLAVNRILAIIKSLQ